MARRRDIFIGLIYYINSMKNSSISLAFFTIFTLAFAALLSACSGDEGNSPADLCKKGPSKACLAGEWRFEKIEEDPSTTCRGNLIIEENRYSFTGGCGTYELNFMGSWDLDGTNIKIHCTLGDCDGYTRTGTITVKDGITMSIRNNAQKAAISWYETDRVSNPTEIFTRK